MANAGGVAGKGGPRKLNKSAWDRLGDQAKSAWGKSTPANEQQKRLVQYNNGVESLVNRIKRNRSNPHSY